jgi:hypothetical protein
MKIVLKTSYNEPRVLPSDLPGLVRLGFIESDLSNPSCSSWFNSMLTCAKMAFQYDFSDVCSQPCLMAYHISYEPVNGDELTIGGISEGMCHGKFTFIIRNKVYITSSLTTATGGNRLEVSQVIDLF